MAYNLVRRKEDNVVEWFGHGYTWVDKDNRYEHYIYMHTIDKDEEQSYPEKTILRYNGSSDTKNIPNTEAHDNMISSSKDIEIDLLTYNTDDIGWWEAYYIFLHNWPDSRKPDPKTGKYNFGDDLKNEHATGATKQGFTTYELIASQIQLAKLKDEEGDRILGVRFTAPPEDIS